MVPAARWRASRIEKKGFRSDLGATLKRKAFAFPSVRLRGRLLLKDGDLAERGRGKSPPSRGSAGAMGHQSLHWDSGQNKIAEHPRYANLTTNYVRSSIATGDKASTRRTQRTRR